MFSKNEENSLCERSIKPLTFTRDFFERMNLELLSHIFSFLTLQEQLKCQQVCKVWRNCFVEPSLRLETRYDEKWHLQSYQFCDLILQKKLTSRKLITQYTWVLLKNPDAYGLAFHVSIFGYNLKLLKDKFSNVSPEMNEWTSQSDEKCLTLMGKSNKRLKKSKMSYERGYAESRPREEYKSLEEFDKEEILSIQNRPYLLTGVSLAAQIPNLRKAYTHLKKLLRDFPEQANSQFINAFAMPKELESEPRLQKYRCTQSGKIPFIPVNDLCGHLFDYISLKYETGPLKCPVTQIPLELDKIKFNKRAFLKIQKCCKELFNQHSSLSWKKLFSFNDVQIVEFSNRPAQKIPSVDSAFNDLQLSLIKSDFNERDMRLLGIHSKKDLKTLTINLKTIQELEELNRIIDSISKNFKETLTEVDYMSASQFTTQDFENPDSFCSFWKVSRQEFGEIKRNFDATCSAGKKMASILLQHVNRIRRLSENMRMFTINSQQHHVVLNMFHIGSLKQENSFDSLEVRLQKIIDGLEEAQDEPDKALGLFRIYEELCKNLKDFLMGMNHLSLKYFEIKRQKAMFQSYLSQPAILEYWMQNSLDSLSSLQQRQQFSLPNLFRLVKSSQPNLSHELSFGEIEIDSETLRQEIIKKHTIQSCTKNEEVPVMTYCRIFGIQSKLEFSNQFNFDSSFLKEVGLVSIKDLNILSINVHQLYLIDDLCTKLKELSKENKSHLSILNIFQHLKESLDKVSKQALSLYEQLNLVERKDLVSEKISLEEFKTLIVKLQVFVQLFEEKSSHPLDIIAFYKENQPQIIKEITSLLNELKAIELKRQEALLHAYLSQNQLQENWHLLSIKYQHAYPQGLTLFSLMKKVHLPFENYFSINLQKF